ncbi:MAG: nucleotide exchange factor GrpE [Desulfatibacillaceae bacterium]
MKDTEIGQAEDAARTDAGDPPGDPAVESDPGMEDVLEKDIEQKLLETEEESKQLHDRLLRLSAEFDNYKKRSDREAADFRKFANERLVKDLLPVLDNLERAMEATNGEAASEGLREGVEMTRKELLKILEKNGVTPIDARGQPFDPTFHEAMMQQDHPDHEANTVISEVQKGYLMHGRLLRPSLVIVASGNPGQ